MRSFTYIILVLLLSVTPSYGRGDVDPGIDVLASRGFDLLKGRSVGLITNHTGLTRDGRSTIDVLAGAPGVRLVALLSPEHGIRGDLDAGYDNGRDDRTGLPVYSLYGATRKPTAAMLKGIDTLVFDIQDIGTRFYTYIGTMALAMQAAREQRIAFVVLDRPNPIGGLRVEGAVPPKELSGTLTCIYPIPTRHGMTVGELARLFNKEFGIGCDLTVVPVRNWERHQLWDGTGLLWVNPSPNMKTLTGALLYPGLGIAETTTLSVGRGTDHPFEWYGAPWADAGRVARNLARRRTPGVRFVPVSFVPTAPGHIHKDIRCNGVAAVVYDRDLLDPVTAGLHLVQAFFEEHPREMLAFSGFKGLLGDPDAWDLLTARSMTPESVASRWMKGRDLFLGLRERYLLYR